MGYSQRQVARMAGVSRDIIRRRIDRALTAGVQVHETDGTLSDAFVEYVQTRQIHKFDPYSATPPPPPTTTTDTLPQVTGLTPADRFPDGDALWEEVIKHQGHDAAKTERRYAQKITVPGEKPILLVLVSDPHFGNQHTDYVRLKSDAELIRDTPGAYAVLLGDYLDAWIVPKLGHIQREQAVNFAKEVSLMVAWLTIMKDKLLVVVKGNHDNRIDMMSGIDIYAHLLKDVKTLYDANEVSFTLSLGSAEWRWKVRHAWRGHSMWNTSHGPERDARFNDGSWDIAAGGHQHRATNFREFFDEAAGKRKLICDIGAYYYDSTFGRRVGFPRAHSCGSAGIMFWPTGEFQQWHSLARAVRFLERERA